MKTWGVMAAIYMGPEQRGYVQQVAERFKRLNKMPVRVIHDGDLPGVYLANGHWARYYAWDIVPSDVERIIYMDTDMLPLRALPELPDVDFAAPTDYDTTKNMVLNSVPYLKEKGIYFNSGFFIATRKTRKAFRRVLDLMPSEIFPPPFFADQTPLNIEIQRGLDRNELTFKLLSQKWSCLPLHDARIQDPYMVHCTGIKWQKKLQFVNYFLTHINQVEAGTWESE